MTAGLSKWNKRGDEKAKQEDKESRNPKAKPGRMPKPTSQMTSIEYEEHLRRNGI